MSFRDLEQRISTMVVPMDTNQQDNYDYMMATAQDPSSHEIDNIPPPQADHWGTNMGVSQPQSKYSEGSMGSNRDGEKNPVHKHTMPEGSTKTKGKGKKR